MSEVPEYNGKITFILDGCDVTTTWNDLKEKCVLIYQNGGRMNITAKVNVTRDWYMNYNFGRDYKKRKDIIIKDINAYDVYNSDSINLNYCDDEPKARIWWEYMLKNSIKD